MRIRSASTTTGPLDVRFDRHGRSSPLGRSRRALLDYRCDINDSLPHLKLPAFNLARSRTSLLAPQVCGVICEYGRMNRFWSAFSDPCAPLQKLGEADHRCKGVRNSWLILARNSALVPLATSIPDLRSSRSCVYCAWIARRVPRPFCAP